MWQARRLALGADPLDVGLAQIGEAIKFLQLDPHLQDSAALIPLQRLALDLHDLLDGGRPALLKRRGVTRSRKGARAGFRRGALAHAMSVLTCGDISAGALRLGEAGKLVAEHLTAKRPGGGPVNGRTVENVYSEVRRADPADDPGRRFFDQLEGGTVRHEPPSWTRARRLQWLARYMAIMAACGVAAH
jgi:hypothetical protein